MNFNHSEDRQMLADTLGRFIADRYTFDTRTKAANSETGYDPAIWGELNELGMVGALFGEEVGGFGGKGFDTAVVFEALGRGLVVEPFLGALMVGRALEAAGGRTELIGEIAGGTIVAFAHQEPQGRYAPDAVATTARKDGEGWVLDGTKAVVAQAEAAEWLLVSAKSDAGLSLFLVPKGAEGLSIRGYLNIDGGRSGEVSLNGVKLGGDALVGSDGGAQPAIEAATRHGLLALCAEALGAMDVAKEATVEYLRTRVQFGVPIGKFQALQHRMATVLLEVEQARSAVINAAAAIDGDDLRAADRALSAAKYTIGAVGTLTAEEAIQMHGGIGMTWELPLPHYAKRITMIGHQLGDEDYHLQRYTALGRGA